MTEAGTPISQSSVWDIQGRKPPRKISVGEAVALARVFDISIEELIEPPRAAADQLSELRSELGTIRRTALGALDQLQALIWPEVELVFKRPDLAPEIRASSIDVARHITEIRDAADNLLKEVVRRTVGFVEGKPQVTIFEYEIGRLQREVGDLRAELRQMAATLRRGLDATSGTSAHQVKVLRALIEDVLGDAEAAG